MVLVGVDNSVNSPGIVWYVLDKNLQIERKNFLGFTTVKKNSTSNIIHFKKDQFKDGIAQYTWMRDTIYNTIYNDINQKLPDYVAIENYSFQSKGLVFNIAEATGAIKVKFYENNIPMRLHDPNSIKLYSTGFGNADKKRMKEEYDKLPEDKKLKGIVNEDIVDAFFICDLLYQEILLRKGVLVLKDLDENQIRVMNRVTKSYPTNLLATDFIQK